MKLYSTFMFQSIVLGSAGQVDRQLATAKEPAVMCSYM